jgi:uncharacterized repeat protein (TIGR03943 family)
MGLTRTSLLYVRPASRTWLVLAGAALVLIGVASLVLARRHRAEDGHHRLGRVGWLLVLPVVVAVAVGSNPLGSYAAGRQNSQRTLPRGSFDLEEYLHANSLGGQAPALRVLDFTRAAYDPDEQELLADTPVTLTGFVTEDADESDPHHFLLTRFEIGCCAADALAMFVQVDLDDHNLPPVDSWVEIRGVLIPPDPLEEGEVITDPPVLEASDVRAVDEPSEVYEYPP